MHEGHRKRMLERLAAGDGFREHELLEILLYNAIPRKNTNEIAHDLLTAFGNLSGVMDASMSELMRVNGVGSETAAYLHCVSLFCKQYTARKPEPLPPVYNVNQFSGFLSARLGGLEYEVIEAYLVNAQGQFRYCKRFTAGHAGSAAVAPEDLSELIAAWRPAGLIVAHNHPDCTGNPSAADDTFTAQVAMLCSINNVRLLDHIIVGKDDVYSYYLLGRLEKIKDAFDAAKIFGKGVRE